MSARTPRRRLLAVAATLAVGSLVITGCSSSKTSTSGAGSSASAIPTPTAVASLAALLPADLKSSGKLVVAADASYAPNEFKDAKGNIVGMDVDMANAIAQTLGLTADVQNADFTSIIPGITANKYQLGHELVHRHQGPRGHRRHGHLLLGRHQRRGEGGQPRQDRPDRPLRQEGRGADRHHPGRRDHQHHRPRLRQGRQAGRRQRRRQVRPPDRTSPRRWWPGRDQVMLADSPVVDYASSRPTASWRRSAAPPTPPPTASWSPRAPPLTKAVQGAVQSLMANGTYKAILTKWGVQAGAIDSSVINGATS